jgi:hypothetical protein
VSKGVISPWATPKKETAEERLDRIQEESPEGIPQRQITFNGRAFQITVSFFSMDTDQARLSGYAHDALGRVITAALQVDDTLSVEFKRQSITRDPSTMLVPKVKVELGELALYVKASSFDAAMARLMALDRIALALSDACGASRKVRKVMTDHEVVVARKV